MDLNIKENNKKDKEITNIENNHDADQMNNQSNISFHHCHPNQAFVSHNK